jgi:hypothetical protein
LEVTMENGFAGAALDFAMTTMCDAASPWRVPPDVYGPTRSAFREDFETWIVDQASWQDWREIVRRQARSLGAMAAFLADLDVGKGEQLPPPGRLTLGHIAAATQLVKSTCRSMTGPEPSKPGSRGKLCRAAFPDAAPEHAAADRILELLKPASAL